MKRIEIEVLGLKAQYDVPASLEEARTLAPVKADGSDPLLDRVNGNTLYHQVFGDLRSGLVEWIEKTGVAKRARSKETVNGKETEVITEKNEPFVKRVLAEGAVTNDDLKEQLQDMCDNAEYSFGEYLKSERRHAGPKKLPKEIEAAVATAVKDGTNVAIAEKLTRALGRTIDGNDPQSLGEAIREHRNRRVQAALAAAKAEAGL